MDYRSDQYYRMQQLVANQVADQVNNPGDYGQKMPFYMTYPIQSIYMTEMEYEEDMERMKNLYPSEVRKIQSIVEDECDKLEYDGSLMFDEHPDRLMLRRISDRIYDKVTEGDVNAQQFCEGCIQPRMQRPGGPPPPPRPPRSPQGPPTPRRPQDSGLNNLIEVLLFNEMFKRRCRYRRCRRWW